MEDSADTFFLEKVSEISGWFKDLGHLRKKGTTKTENIRQQLPSFFPSRKTQK